MYEFDSRVRYSEVDREGRLTLDALLNYFQDCSNFESEDLGRGIQYMEEHHRLWVLSSWQIVVKRYPSLGERVKTITFPHAFRGFLGYRNFAMLDESGSYLAMANSLWSFLNADTFKPATITPEISEGFVVGEKLPMEYAKRRIELVGDGERMEPVTVKPHHLDTNQHVNNGQYVSIAMDYLKKDILQIRQLRVEYKKQALLGDIFIPYVERREGITVISLEDEAGSPYAVVEFQDGEDNV